MQKKKAISLIVLVIIIIIVIILAGTIILTLNNSGIIQKASEVVEASDEETVNQLAELAWAEAYADGVRSVEDLVDGIKGFRRRIEEALENNKLDPEKYLLNVTTKGVTAKLLDKAWVKKGFTVVRGEQVLEIGDIVAYDETVGGTKNDLTATEWKVLGADADGNLLLMSTRDIKTNFVLGASNLLAAQQDWLNGSSVLDAKCEAYGYGKGVVGKARSITIEDIDLLTGYDKTTYGKGQLYQYGNEVTYFYNGTTKPAYSSVVRSGITGTGHIGGFHFYNGEEFVVVNDLTSTEKNGEPFAVLKNNVYHYYVGDLLTISSTDNKKVYSMLFGESEDSYYWLASNYIGVRNGYAFFGMYCITEANVSGCNLWFSHGYYGSLDCGIRAVVTLSSNIEFTGSSDAGWSY